MSTAILANLYLINIKRWTDRRAALLVALEGLEACVRQDDKSIPEGCLDQLKEIVRTGTAFLKAIDSMKTRL